MGYMICVLMLILAAGIHLSTAFTPTGMRIGIFNPQRALEMKSGKAGLTTTVVQLSGTEVTLRGMAMTDALQDKIVKKVIDGTVNKLGESQVVSTHITLSLEPREQIADVRCNMKGGAIVEAKSGAENMYTSLDLVSKKLGENLKKHSSIVKDKHKKDGKLGGSTTEDEADILNEV